MSVEFQFGKMKKGFRMDGGDGCTTMWMYLMPLSYTLKNSLNGWTICYIYFITIKKWIKHQNVKLKPLKLLKENLGVNLNDPGFGNGLLDKTLKTKETKEKQIH